MTMRDLWVSDPHSGKKSVSLTLVVVSAAVVVIAMGLEMSGLIKTTSMAFEFFGTSCGLYWGRKYTSAKGASLDAGKDMG